ncbi:MAG: hypothetical protein ACPG6V_12795 [Flavobacteriales bacterium]
MDFQSKLHAFTNDISKIEKPKHFPSPFNKEPHVLAKLAAEQCLEFLKTCESLKQNPKYIDLLNHNRIGKMFGVLVVENSIGAFCFLAAFSGKLLGENSYEYFVPPIFDMNLPNAHYKKEEKELLKISENIAALEMDSLFKDQKTKYQNLRTQLKQSLNINKSQKSSILSKIKKLDHLFATNHRERLTQLDVLKQTRKLKSKALQKWLFEQYEISNKFLNIETLENIFGEGNIPSGAGECAAPKLFHFAFQHHLKPICLAEFWFGRSTNSNDKQTENYYPSCTEKCLPILNFMLDENFEPKKGNLV